MSQKEKIRICFIGCGRFCRNFIPLFKAHPSVEKVYVCDLIPERAKDYSEKFDVEIIPSFEEAIASDKINSVAIFTQRYTHGDLVIAALKAGKNVYSAVPCSISVEKIKEIERLVRETRLVYTMGETGAYRAATVFCRREFKKGTFGQFVWGEAHYNHDIDGTTYVSDGNGFDLGKAAGYDHYVVDLNSISRFMYPALWKQGPYRTDTDAPEGIGFQNANSTRPYIIYKFSDLYFIAAEAAVKNPSVVTDSNYSAYNLINVIRARAGKWEYKNNEQKEYTADFSAELVAATPTTITIDFLLDEMLREYFGEGRRWFDLTRTQQWLERALTTPMASGMLPP